MVLGEDRKPFKTRSGETIKLNLLIDEAISKAKAAMSEKNQIYPMIKSLKLHKSLE